MPRCNNQGEFSEGKEKREPALIIRITFGAYREALGVERKNAELTLMSYSLRAMSIYIGMAHPTCHIMSIFRCFVLTPNERLRSFQTSSTKR